MWERRVKIISPVIQNDPERAYIFQILLKKRPEVRQMQEDVLSGGMIIDFDPLTMTKNKLFNVIDEVLGNIQKKSQTDREPANNQAFSNVQEILLMVEGMSCPACAALIEMSLKKDHRVEDASADLETKEVKVYGMISKQALIEKIEKLGYKHITDA